MQAWTQQPRGGHWLAVAILVAVGVFKAMMEADLDRIRQTIAANQRADRQYMAQGIQLLELAQTAWQSYSRRSPTEKRKLLNFVCSNCVLKDGVLTLPYREPFAWLALAVQILTDQEAPDPSDRRLLEIRGG